MLRIRPSAWLPQQHIHTRPLTLAGREPGKVVWPCSNSRGMPGCRETRKGKEGESKDVSSHQSSSWISDGAACHVSSDHDVVSMISQITVRLVHQPQPHPIFFSTASHLFPTLTFTHSCSLAVSWKGLLSCLLAVANCSKQMTSKSSHADIMTLKRHLVNTSIALMYDLRITLELSPT